MWNILVGSKTARTVVLALGAILIFFTKIMLWVGGIKRATQKQVLQEVELENIKREQQTREKIDEAVRNSPRDRDGAVERLRERESRRK